MYNITLVCTRHEELGSCNSDRLHDIIEAINPQVIFEEIPPSYFDKYYVKKSARNLETGSINKYLETHKIEHIPVDSEDVPPDSFFEEYRHMLEKVEGLADINGYNYRHQVDVNRIYVGRYGFDYLNSVYSDSHYDIINNVIENGLQKIGSEKLFQTFIKWKKINEKREYKMLQNIYEYCGGHGFEQGVFTLGAGHRKSIVQKVRQCQTEEKLKLNWQFYNE